MKTKQAAFIAVAVVFRTAALAAVALGVFAVLMPLVAFSGSMSPGLSIGLLRVLLGYLIAAALLWLVAKPAAALVLRGLDDRRFELDDFREQ